MAYSEELALRVRQSLGEQAGVVEKKMFGGLCFMVRGNMCCGVTGDEIIARVGPEQYEDALTLPHARLMDFTGRPMRGFIAVRPEGLSSDEDLAAWIARCLNFTASLPPK